MPWHKWHNIINYHFRNCRGNRCKVLRYAQAGAEVAFQCLTSAAVGSGLVHNCSSWMDHGSLVSPEFMVLTHDIVDSVHHFMKGIPVTEEILAVDIIDKVGPGCHYLTQEHTMNNFRQIKYSELFDRSVYGK